MFGERKMSCNMDGRVYSHFGGSNCVALGQLVLMLLCACVRCTCGVVECLLALSRQLPVAGSHV